MHAGKLRVATGATGVLLVALYSCTEFPADVRAERLAYLNAVVDEVDLGSISTVVCDYTFGEPGISSGYYRTQFVEGPESLDAAFERLSLFDLAPQLTEQRFFAYRSDNIALSGMVVPRTMTIRRSLRDSSRTGATYRQAVALPSTFPSADFTLQGAKVEDEYRIY